MTAAESDGHELVELRAEVRRLKEAGHVGAHVI